MQSTKSKITRKSRPSQSDFFVTKPGRLDLADGSVFFGQIPADQTVTITGEVVFNTGMTGYVETLTDPSYSGQILVFTYPIIGNYGVQTDNFESNEIKVRGVVVGEAALYGSHSDSSFSFLEWLKSQGIPILAGVDTRMLTKHLRVNGTMLGAIGAKAYDATKLKIEKNYASIKVPQLYNDQKTKTVILIDCGLKENILRSLMSFPISIKRVPYDYDFTREAYDGVVISNGPGDPEDYGKTIDITRQALAGNKPVFGICLGSQVMALAAGAKTYKLKFGHRGQNQPCQDLDSGRCYITSQNHGYAVDAGSLPKDWYVSYRNLNDNSVEGIAHKSKPFFAVQFHPEACPGPTDTEWMFANFYNML